MGSQMRDHKDLLAKTLEEQESMVHHYKRLYEMRNNSLQKIRKQLLSKITHSESIQFLNAELESLQEQVRDNPLHQQFDMETLLRTQTERRKFELELNEAKRQLLQFKSDVGQIKIYKKINEMNLLRIWELEDGRKGLVAQSEDQGMAGEGVKKVAVTVESQDIAQLDSYKKATEKNQKEIAQNIADMQILDAELKNAEETIKNQKELLLEMNNQSEAKSIKHQQQIVDLLDKHEEQMNAQKEAYEKQIADLTNNAVSHVTEGDQKLLQVRTELEGKIKQLLEFEILLQKKETELENEKEITNDHKNRINILTKSMEEFQKQADEKSEKQEAKIKKIQDESQNNLEALIAMQQTSSDEKKMAMEKEQQFNK